jgi:hypothetical protein
MESDRSAPVCHRLPPGPFSARGFETWTRRSGSNFHANLPKNPSPCAPIGVQLRVAKSNYHQVRRQKELSRKTRQQEKQQKRLAAKSAELDPNAPVIAESGDPAAAPSGDSVNVPVGGTSA